MTGDPARQVYLALVCEGDGDERVVTSLVDRVIVENVLWVDEHVLSFVRQWQGERGAESYLPWDKVRERAADRGIQVHGQFPGEPLAPDATAARKALLLLNVLPPDGVILLRDGNGEGSERRRGLEQARVGQWPFPVVAGIADPKRECWVLAAFDPATPDEQRILWELRKELGFDPREASERLHAKAADAKRNPKVVLDRLIGGHVERERRACESFPLQELKRRSANNGLRDFLQCCEAQIPRLFF